MSGIVRIVKVGGSLLDWPGLPRALRGWMDFQAPALNVLLCGGGPFAEVVRRADRAFALGEERSHWLAVDCLSMTTRLLAGAARIDRLIESYGELVAVARTSRPDVVVFDCREYLQHHESSLPGTVLPHDWTATSDSIAARLAETLAADELVLLKSSTPPSASLDRLAEGGYVDGHFPLACRGLAQPRLVNLREFGDFA